MLQASLSQKAMQDEIDALRAEVAALKLRAERAEALADHDVLTPVFNRRGFITNAQQRMAYCRRYAVDTVMLYLDLDGFKTLNDTLGHPAGDAALIYLAEKLIHHVRESDAIGRMGGDEFAVLLMNADLEAGKEKARILSENLKTDPFVWQGQPYPLSASIGVRMMGDHKDPEAWLAEADASMWLRKAHRRVER